MGRALLNQVRGDRGLSRLEREAPRAGPQREHSSLAPGRRKPPSRG